MLGKLLLTCFLALGSLDALAKEPLILNKIQNVKLQNHWLLLEDKTDQLTIEDILREKQKDFVTGDQPTPAGGYSASSFWLKIAVLNHTDLESWYLGSQSYVWSTFEIYVVADGKPSQGVKKQDRLPKRYPVVKVDLPQHEQITLYLHVKTIDFLSFDFALRPEIYSRDGSEDALVYLLVGIICSLVIYNGFLLVSLRDVTYLYYLLYALCNGFLALCSVSV